MPEAKEVPSDVQKSTLQYVLDRFQRMSDARRDFESEWEDNEAAYIAPFRSNDQYSSDVNLPVEFTHIQHAMAEIMDSPPNMSFVPKNSKGLKKMDIAQAVWDFVWEKSDTSRQMYWLYLSIFVHGTGIWFEGYQRTTRKTYKKIGLNKDDLKRLGLPDSFLDDKDEEEDECVEYDDVYGEWVPNKEFYVDETAKTFWEPTHSKDARDCIRKRYYSRTSFYQAWSKYEDAKYVTDTYQDADTYKNAEEQSREKAPEEMVEVIEYWNRETQRYIVVANRTHVINGEKGESFRYSHGRLPFCVCPCFPVPNSPWGKGLVSLLRGVRAQEDLIMNIGLDHGKNAIQPPLLKASSMEVLDEEWYAGMGYILNVSGSLDDIKELPVGELSNNFFALLDRLESYEVLGTGQDVRALIKSEPTAFQQANKKEISLKRLKVILQFINWEALSQMADLRYANIRQIYSLPEVEVISQKDVNGDGVLQATKDLMLQKEAEEGDDPTPAVSEVSDMLNGMMVPKSGRMIRVKNKQVVHEVDRLTGHESPSPSMIPADGYTDFFELDPEDLEDYDITIEFQLNTSKELKKLRFSEAINILPNLLKVATVNLINPTQLLELWADTYEMPQTILNKTNDATSQQVPLGAQPPEPGMNASSGASPQMSPQPQSLDQSIGGFAQQSFNSGQAAPAQ